jgi:chromosome segregation ATPase
MRRLIALAGASLVVLAGCGGDGGGGALSKEDYQKELTAATTQVEKAFTDLGAAFDNVSNEKGSLEDAAGEVGKIQDELNAAADDLDGVEPPENISQANDDLVEGLRQLSEDLEEMKTALEEGDAGALSKIGAGFENLESAKLLEKATNALEKEGYKLGSDAS